MGSSAYSDGSYTSRSGYSDEYSGSETPLTTARSGMSSRFSFGTPRTSAEFDDERDFERDYSSRYSGSRSGSKSVRSYKSYASTGTSSSRSYYPELDDRSYRDRNYDSSGGELTARSGTTMTDFSARSYSRPSTGGSNYTPRSDYTGDSRSTTGSSFDSQAYTETSGTNTEGDDRMIFSVGKTHSDVLSTSTYASTVHSDERTDAANTTADNIRLAKVRSKGGGYGKGSRKPDHRKMDKNSSGGPRFTGTSLSNRMIQSGTAASEQLIQQAFNEQRKRALGQKQEEESKLAPLSARDGAFRTGDHNNVIITDPSPLHLEMKEKEDQKAMILGSNPNSRPQSEQEKSRKMSMMGGPGGPPKKR
jgi:hypothetical protein